MQFLKSKLLKAECSKWQITELMLSFIPTIMAPKVIELFSIRISSIGWFKYLINNRWDSVIIVNIWAEGEPTFKDWRKKVIKDLLIKRIFSISISSSLRIWLDLNNGLECESLDWKFIIFKAFFCVIIIQFKECRFWPHIRLA